MRLISIAGLAAILAGYTSFGYARPSQQVPQGSISGQVVGVHDGDTITVLTEAKTQVRVRLACIDAPELDQPGGQDSKQGLSSYIFRHNVRITSYGVDQYGRTIGDIWDGATLINLVMVKQGLAWDYRHYCSSQAFADAEIAARAGRVGLWRFQADQQTPPWEWRRKGLKP